MTKIMHAILSHVSTLTTFVGLLILTACTTPTDEHTHQLANDDVIDGANPEAATPATGFPSYEEQKSYPTDALREHMVGRVYHIVDGDTLDLEVRGKRFKIRFKGASAPECFKDPITVDGVPRQRCTSDDEYYGLQSYRELVDIVGDREVQVRCERVGAGQPCEQDHYGRWLANLVREDGIDIGEELLRRGAGFTSTAFESDTRKNYCKAEYEARSEGRGMWKDKTVQETIQLMSDGTQRWYRAHDRRCDIALDTL